LGVNVERAERESVRASLSTLHTPPKHPDLGICCCTSPMPGVISNAAWEEMRSMGNMAVSLAAPCIILGVPYSAPPRAPGNRGVGL